MHHDGSNTQGSLFKHSCIRPISFCNVLKCDQLVWMSVTRYIICFNEVSMCVLPNLVTVCWNGRQPLFQSNRVTESPRLSELAIRHRNDGACTKITQLRYMILLPFYCHITDDSTSILYWSTFILLLILPWTFYCWFYCGHSTVDRFYCGHSTVDSTVDILLLILIPFYCHSIAVSTPILYCHFYCHSSLNLLQFDSHCTVT